MLGFSGFEGVDRKRSMFVMEGFVGFVYMLFYWTVSMMVIWKDVKILYIDVVEGFKERKDVEVLV